MLKKTKTRELVQKLLTNHTSPLSANEIYEQLKDEKITLSSIYRTLETFTNKNIIIKDNIIWQQRQRHGLQEQEV